LPTEIVLAIIPVFKLTTAMELDPLLAANNVSPSLVIEIALIC
jgi:hypothetical protein